MSQIQIDVLIDIFFSFQASQRAITDIDRRVRKISGTARKYYTTTELSPFLDDLDQSTEETLQLMDNLSLSLRCEPIFRWDFENDGSILIT